MFLEPDAWESLLELAEDLDELAGDRRYPSDLGPQRTADYHAARARRVGRLRDLVEAGDYEIPAILVAEGFLFGRPKWGEALIDDNGDRRDEPWRIS